MAAQRQAPAVQVPLEVLFARAGPQVAQQRENAVRDDAGRVLELRDLLRLVHDPEAVLRVHQEVSRVDDLAGAAAEVAQQVGEVRGDLERPRAAGHERADEVLPAHAADAGAAADAAVAQDRAQRARRVARLAHKAELLEQLDLEAERRIGQVPHALVTDDQTCPAIGAQEQQGFLEPRVQAGEVGQVGAVFTVAVDREHVELRPADAVRGMLEPGLQYCGGQLRQGWRPPEIGQVYACELDLHLVTLTGLARPASRPRSRLPLPLPTCRPAG